MATSPRPQPTTRWTRAWTRTASSCGASTGIPSTACRHCPPPSSSGTTAPWSSWLRRSTTRDASRTCRSLPTGYSMRVATTGRFWRTAEGRGRTFEAAGWWTSSSGRATRHLECATRRKGLGVGSEPDGLDVDRPSSSACRYRRQGEPRQHGESVPAWPLTGRKILENLPAHDGCTAAQRRLPPSARFATTAITQQGGPNAATVDVRAVEGEDRTQGQEEAER